MKPIEKCLDILLHQLKENWNIQPYPPLNVDALMGQMDVPLARHEFFKKAVDVLIEDKYAFHFEGYNHNLWPNPIDFVKAKTMLTPRGIYFIEQGGYTQQSIDASLEQERNRAIASSPLGLNRLTGWLVLATGALVVIELIKMTHEYHWWPFCGK